MISQKRKFDEYECLCVVEEGFQAVAELARLDDLLKSFFESLVELGGLTGVDEKIADRIDLMLEIYFSWNQCYRDAIEWNLRDLKKNLEQAQAVCEPVNDSAGDGVFAGELGTGTKRN